MQHGTRPRASVPGRSCRRQNDISRPSTARLWASAALGAVMDVVAAVPRDPVALMTPRRLAGPAEDVRAGVVLWSTGYRQVDLKERKLYD